MAFFNTPRDGLQQQLELLATPLLEAPLLVTRAPASRQDEHDAESTTGSLTTTAPSASSGSSAKASYLWCFFLLVTSPFGAGVLTLPYALTQGGWVFCSAAFLLCSVLSALANYYLALLARHFECDKYGDLLQVVVEKAFAEKVAVVLEPTLIRNEDLLQERSRGSSQLDESAVEVVQAEDVEIGSSRDEDGSRTMMKPSFSSASTRAESAVSLASGGAAESVGSAPEQAVEDDSEPEERGRVPRASAAKMISCNKSQPDMFGGRVVHVIGHAQQGERTEPNAGDASPPPTSRKERQPNRAASGWIRLFDAMMAAMTVCAVASYFMFLADFLSQLWTAVAPGPGSYVPSRRVFIFGIAALAFPAATVERLTELKFLSSLSLFSMLFVVAAVFAEAAESASANAGEQLALLGEEAGGRAAEADGGAAAGGLAPAPSVGLLPSSFASGVQSFSVVFFSNVNQMCSVAITSSLAATTSSKGSKCKSTQHRRLRSVIFAAAFLVGLLYFAVASAVVVRNQRHTLPNFLANYDVDDALMVVARFLLTGVLLLSVTVDTYSARQAIARIVENWWFADQDYYHHHRVGGLDRQLRFRVVIVFLTLAFCASLACTITNVAEAISITSSLFASSVAMGVPAALVLLCPEVAEKEGLPLRRAGPALLLGLTLLLWGNVLAKIAAV